MSCGRRRRRAAGDSCVTCVCVCVRGALPPGGAVCAVIRRPSDARRLVTDTSLTVQWEKVPLQEANNTAFSFQVSS